MKYSIINVIKMQKEKLKKKIICVEIVIKNLKCIMCEKNNLKTDYSLKKA